MTKQLSARKLVLVALKADLLRSLLATHLERVLGHEVIAESAAVGEVANLCSEHQPDIIILDHLGLESLSELVRKLGAQPKAVPILFLARNVSEIEILMRTGVAGCIAEGDSLHLFDQAVGAVLSGGRFFTRSAPSATTVPSVELTDRQLEVFRLIAKGDTTKEVAWKLGLSVKTADHHRTRLMKKLNVHSVVELVRWAAHYGLADPE